MPFTGTGAFDFKAEQPGQGLDGALMLWHPHMGQRHPGPADAAPEPRRMLARSPDDDPGRGLARRQALELGMAGPESRYGYLARGLIQPAGIRRGEPKTS